MRRLPAGVATPSVRSSASHIFCAVEGSGTTPVEGMELAWERGDVFVVPSWHRYRHCAREDAILFNVSDEPALRALGFLRSEEG